MGDISVLKETMKILANERQEVAVATITKASGSAPRGVGTKMGVLKDGSIIGTIGGGALEKHIIDLSLEALETGESKSHSLNLSDKEIKMICGGAVDVFIDVYKNRSKLMIFGGGHVGYAIYKQALLLDFDIDIFDDREEFANKERFPEANEIFTEDLDEIFQDYKVDDNTYVIIVTRGHSHDEKALEKVVNSNAKYVGSMGSKKKILEMMKSLKEKGYSQENLQKVYAPVGLDIASEKPAEIAVSIMGEILMVKNNGSPANRKMDLVK